jgi:hypothetical protein
LLPQPRKGGASNSAFYAYCRFSQCDPETPHPDEVLVLGQGGTVVVMNTHAWQGGTANRIGKPRRALHAFYTRGDRPQQQYQKALLRAETQARLLAGIAPHPGAGRSAQ